MYILQQCFPLWAVFAVFTRNQLALRFLTHSLLTTFDDSPYSGGPSTRVTPVTLINWSTNSKHLANIVLADCSSLLSSFVSLTFWLCIDINVRLQANQCGQFDFNILHDTLFPPSRFLCLTKQYYLVHLKSSVKQSHAMNKCEPVVARHKVVVDGLILPATN